MSCLSAAAVRRCGHGAGAVMVLPSRARSPGEQRAGMRFKLCRHEIVPSRAAAAVPAGPGLAFKYNRGGSAWHSRVALA